MRSWIKAGEKEKREGEKRRWRDGGEKVESGEKVERRVLCLYVLYLFTYICVHSPDVSRENKTMLPLSHTSATLPRSHLFLTFSFSPLS